MSSQSKEVAPAVHTAYQLDNEVNTTTLEDKPLSYIKNLYTQTLYIIEFDMLDHQFREDTSALAHIQYLQLLKKLKNLKACKSNFVVSENACIHMYFVPKLKH